MKRKLDKKKTQLLEDFLSLGEKCDIKIIHDKGDFNGDNCLLFANNTIVINKHKPLDQRLHVLAKCYKTNAKPKKPKTSQRRDRTHRTDALSLSFPPTASVLADPLDFFGFFGFALVL